MTSGWAGERVRAREGDACFCLEVYLAGLKTCFFSHVKGAPPAILLSVLDFEPLVFEVLSADCTRRSPSRAQGVGRQEGIRKEEAKQEADVEGREDDRRDRSRGSRISDARADGSGVHQRDHPRARHRKLTHHRTSQSPTCEKITWNAEGESLPSSLAFNKGKSCIFTADPTDLARAFQQTSALTLLVVSKLSQRQVAIHGSGVVDVSTFGPNAELSRPFPCAVSSWGHLTARVESKDPRGRVVAAVDVTVSLSCLGASGSWIEPTPTAEYSSQSPTLENINAALRSCPSAAAAQHTPLTHRASRSAENPDGGQAMEPETRDILTRTPTDCAVVEDIIETTVPCPGSGEVNQQPSGFLQGQDCWTCDYDPRDGSLRDNAPSSAKPAMTDDATTTTTTVANASVVSNACALSPFGVENQSLAAVAETTQGVVSAEGCDDGRTVLAKPCEDGAINNSNMRSAAEATSSTAVLAAPALSSDLPSATTTPDQDRAPPTPAMNAKMDCTLSSGTTRSGGDGTDIIMAVGEQSDGRPRVTDDATGAEEIVRVKATAECDADGRCYPGNARFAPSWTPRVRSPKQEGGIEIGFHGGPAAGISEAAAPTGRVRLGKTEACRTENKFGRRAAASVRQRRPDGRRGRTSRRTGVSGSERPPPATTAALRLTGKKSPTQRPGKATRRPWGAGPGSALDTAVPEAWAPCDASRRAKKAHQERRGDPNGCGGCGGCGGRRTGSGQAERVKRPPSSRARPSEHPSPPLRSRGAPPGSTDLQLFLPTWTSLVAEAAWLRGSQTNATGNPESTTAAVATAGNCGNDKRMGQNSAARSSVTTPSTSKSHQQVSVSGSLQSSNRPGLRRDQRSAAGERSASSEAEQRGENGSGCDGGGGWKGTPRGQRLVPRPSLEPCVERLLMDWLRSRIDRNGRVPLSGFPDQPEQGVSPWAARLHALFEEALADIAIERKVVPKPGGQNIDSHVPDSLETGQSGGIGWVEVVRRVSSYSERTRAGTAIAKEQRPQATHRTVAPPPPLDVSWGGRMDSCDDRPPDARRSVESIGGDGSDPQTGTASAVGGSPSSPPRPCAQPRRRMSPRPRLPPLSGRSRSPPAPPREQGIAATPPPSRQTVKVTATANGAAGAPEGGSVTLASSGAPASPRASRWLLTRSGNHGDRADRSAADDDDSQGDGLQPATGGSGGKPTRTHSTRNAKPCSSPASRSPVVGDAAGEVGVAGEVSEEEMKEFLLQSVADGEGAGKTPPHVDGRHRYAETVAALSDRCVEEKHTAEEEEEEEDWERPFVVEDYESDFEADED